MSVAKEQQQAKVDKRRNKSKKKVEWQGFVDCVLTTKVKEELRAMDIEEEYPLAGCEAVVKNGYKLSFSYQANEGTFTASMYDVSPSSEFAGYTLTARGSTLHKSFAALMYKHEVIWSLGWQHRPATGEAEDFA